MSFETVVINTLLMLALGVPGFVLAKIKMIDSKAIKPLSNILLYVCVPFMILKSFLTIEYQPQLLGNILLALLFSFASTLLIMVIALLVFHNKKVVGQKIYQIACMFSNCGFFGLPFLAALFPGNDHVILYASMYIIVFNLATWTLGIFILTGDKKYISLKKALANPAIIFSAIGFVLFLCKVSIPTPAITFSNFWSTMTSPLSMTVTGIRLADMSAKTLVADWRAYVVCGLRLLVAPALTWCMLSLCGITDANLFNTLVIACAMPVAATTVVFAEAFTPQPQAGATTMLLSTTLCIATIPIVCMLFLI